MAGFVWGKQSLKKPLLYWTGGRMIMVRCRLSALI